MKPEANAPVSIVRERFALGSQWPTINPFLFIAHHRDAYPAGGEHYGPTASLDGRQIGSDFADVDGWNMYHGSIVPGFPQHPHRGFETITYVRRGLIDHADSLGAAARYGHGDTQWMTAGAGIVHSEMFPLLEDDGPNPAELFQIWLNLPAADKMAEPAFKMLWADQTPELTIVDTHERTVSATVIAGALGDASPLAPPPDSWAARDESEVAIWHLRFDAGAEWTLPATRFEETNRMIYVFEGDHLVVESEKIEAGNGALIDSDEPALLCAGPGSVECLVLQGRPITEPIARYGPFVMNDNAGLEQAFADYSETGFGGWPWQRPDPVHGSDRRRFATHPDGHIDHPGEG